MTTARGLTLPTGHDERTVEERTAAGRAARKERPRTAIGAWEPSPDRPGAVELLVEQERGRVTELLPIRHARMAASPFAYYRGAAAAMAYDLGTVDCSGLVVQLCGDAHLSNFGLFGAPDRALVFDINDFDETHAGPFEWDVLRLGASFMIAAQENGFAVRDQESVVLAAGEAYRRSMAQYAQMDALSVFYDRVDATFLLDLAKDTGGKPAQRNIRAVLATARRRDRWSALRKLTQEGPDGLAFLDEPPLLARLEHDSAFTDVLLPMVETYRAGLLADRTELLRRYRVIDIAHKVVGVGSVGLRAFVLLMQGRDEADVLILQAKEAVRSVLEPYTSAAGVDGGRRVVHGQRLMQAATDVFLGDVTGPMGRSYYVRQLRDMKWSPEIPALDVNGMRGYAILCGRALARAHARTGDAIAIAAYLGAGDRFDRSVLAFAERYTVQNLADHGALLAAIDAGQVVSTTDEKAATLTSLGTGAARLRTPADH